MANTYFSFKRFTVNQESCAMKVCTDASLFGAWTVKQALTHKPGLRNVLDIGTGTGLLSLMIGQHFDVPIDAVEINGDAAKQASENFSASGWTNLQAYHTSIADFQPGKTYDLIIVNPPFYEGDLLSPDKKRNAAMHDSYLNFQNLFVSIERLLDLDGYAAILLPASREGDLQDLLKQNKFKILNKTYVRQTVNHHFFRLMCLISRTDHRETLTSELSIYDGDRKYAPEFKELLQEYYLAF